MQKSWIFHTKNHKDKVKKDMRNDGVIQKTQFQS